jgi:predicted dehydrogenase
MLKVGIVGLGKMGILHAGILNMLPGCEVVAICERESRITKLAKKVLPRISFYESANEMVERSDLQAVYVTTPTASHANIIGELAKTGRSLGVFMEKPLAGSKRDAERIVERSSSIGKVRMIGFQKRFLPQFARVKNLLDRGALGELVSFSGYSFISSVFSDGRGWRFRRGQGGSLLDLGVHLIDLVLWYFGEPKGLSATERSLYSKDVEDFSQIAFNFDSGLSGSVEVSWSVKGYRLLETQLEIRGKNGSIVVSDDALKMRIERSVPNVISQGNYDLKKPDLISGVDYLLGDPEYCLEDKHFLNCMTDGGKASPNFIDGLKVNRIVEMVHESAREETVRVA